MTTHPPNNLRLEALADADHDDFDNGDNGDYLADADLNTTTRTTVPTVPEPADTEPVQVAPEGPVIDRRNDDGDTSGPQAGKGPYRLRVWEYRVPDDWETEIAGTTYVGRSRAVGRVYRYDFDDPKIPKAFRQFKPDGGGGWMPGGWAERSPYRLPDLDLTKRVVIVEGEQCVDALLAVAKQTGITNVATWSQGANAWSSTDWEPLRAGEALILADGGDTGRQCAEGLARHLHAELGCEVEIVHRGDEAEKDGEDVADWLKSGGVEFVAEIVAKHKRRFVLETDDTDDEAERRVCQKCGRSIEDLDLRYRYCAKHQPRRSTRDDRRGLIDDIIEAVVVPDGPAGRRLVSSLGQYWRLAPSGGYWRPVTVDHVVAAITESGCAPGDEATHRAAQRAVEIAAVQAATPATEAETAAAWNLNTGEPAPPGAAWTDAVVGVDRSGGVPTLATAPVDDFMFRRVPPITWSWGEQSPDPAEVEAIWRFLIGLVGGDDMAAALTADIGRMLCGDWTEPGLLFMHGPTSTGKSTFVQLVAGLLLGPDALRNGDIRHPGFASVTSVAQIGSRFGLAGLSGWRLLAGVDLARIERSDDANAGVDVLKALAVGEPVRVEAKHHQPATVRADCGIVLVSNHRPRFARRASDADAWERRLRIYPTLRQVPAADQRRDYAETLVRAEGQAFARYAVETYTAQVADGSYSAAIPDAMASQRSMATAEGVPPLQRWAQRWRRGGWTAQTDLQADAADFVGELVTSDKVTVTRLLAALREVHGSDAVHRVERGPRGQRVVGQPFSRLDDNDDATVSLLATAEAQAIR
ncbi:MAG: DUF5906 domain-containing protein [Gammaproteobacteria bacterium]|nr:DUF5906 domain-containing protein [Gammaproteobacteria bacterium]